MPLPWNKQTLTEVVTKLVEKAATDDNTLRLLLSREDAKRMIAREFTPETLPANWPQRQFIFDTFADPHGVLTQAFPTFNLAATIAGPDQELSDACVEYRFDLSSLPTVPGTQMHFKGCKPSGTCKTCMVWM